MWDSRPGFLGTGWETCATGLFIIFKE